MSFVSYGLRIGIRARDEAHLRLFQDRFPPGWRPSQAASPVVDRLYSLLIPPTSTGRVRRFNLLYSDALLVARTPDAAELADPLERDIRMFIATESPRRVFVHAGVVGWRGRAIVVPGPTHSGKSSLVCALVRAGAEYLSDEFAVFDDKGRVHPFPSPLSLRARNPDEPAERRCAPESLGRTARRALPVGLVLVTRYRAGARF